MGELVTPLERLSFHVLGPVEVRAGDGVVPVGGPKQRTVLAMFVAHAGKPLNAGVIAQAVYGQDAPARSRRTIQTYVSSLRSVLGDAIARSGDGWALVVDRDAIDVSRFEDSYGSAGELGAEAASGVLREALELWRGDPFSDVEAHGMLDGEVTRLHELRASVVEARIDADLELGRGGDLIGELEALLGEHPYRERLRGQHMLALYRAGRQSEALRSYQELRRLLVDELGVDPSPELQHLEQRLLAQDEALALGSAVTHSVGVGVRSAGPDVDGSASEGGDDPDAGPSRSSSIPSGTVTFLFSDVEGSTSLWAADADAMSASLRVHDELLREVIGSHGGFVFTTAGDAFCVAFDRASDAVACAVVAQERLSTMAWPGPPLRVRIGMHLGDAEERGGDYFGATVNTAARVESAGHGGQILLTEAVRVAAGVVGAVDVGVHRLRDVVEPMHLHQIGEERFPPLRVVPETMSSLPIPATQLLGREDEIRRVRAMLLDHRLVTLTGVGGSGKTRLAIEIAERELPKLAHGAYFADLRSVSDATGVVSAVAEAVRLRSGAGDPLDLLIAHLRDKQALVVLDNCEHVIDACAELAEVALGTPGEWRLLATSREFLDVVGEHVVQVPSLSADGDGAAVALFAERAAAVKPDFAIDESNRSTVAELCERLDGMPLAIELAAARIAVMSSAEMLERIDDRFRLLSGGRRSRQRRRTLEATLAWSYDLLDEEERLMLRSLGVFVGPFDVAAAAAVGEVSTDDAIDLLESLAAKSLVVTTRVGDNTLFGLLETVRAYLEDHLQRSGESQAARDRHLDHHLAALGAETLDGTALLRSGVIRWSRVATNLEAAIDWAIASERFADAAELLIVGNRVWREQFSGRPILDRIDSVQPHLSVDDELHQRLFTPKITVLNTIGDFEQLFACASQARHVRDEQTKLATIGMLATMHAQTDPARTLRLAEEGEAIRPDPVWQLCRAYVRMFAGEISDALDLLPRDPTGESYLIDGTMAVLLLMDGRPTEALQVTNDHPAAASPWMYFSVTVGLCHLALGDREAAECVILDSARTASLGREPEVVNVALVGLAALVDHTGDNRWAKEIILGTGPTPTNAVTALARVVAEQIGVRDEFVEKQDAAAFIRADDTTPFLKDQVARWDATHPS